MKLQEFEKVGKILAKEHKIDIQPGESWAANIKKRKVYYRKNDIYNLSEDHILGLILHEVAHIHYTSNIDIPQKNKELTHSTLNMIEDISIEHIISSDYPNAGEILESTKQEVLDTLLKILPKHKASIYEKALLFAAARFEGRGYLYGKEDYEKLGEKIAEIMIKRENEIYERPNTKDLLPLVKTITDLMIQEAGEPSPEQKQQLMENEMHGNANEDGETDNAKRKIINSLKSGKGWKEGDEKLAQRLEFIDEISDQAIMIGKRLRTILKRNNAMEFGGKFRSGKLKAKRLTKIRITKDRKPFARRIVKSNKSYAFAIASDVSGSMFDNINSVTKSSGSYALSSMHMVGEALRIAGIQRSMIIFGRKAVTINKMGKEPITFQQLGNEADVRKAGQSSTDIAAAMHSCIEELQKSRAERKIMIILTDGSSDLYDMEQMHKKAISQGIEPLGITIGWNYDYMNRVFSEKKNRIIRDTKNTAEIGTAFIDILKESIAESKE